MADKEVERTENEVGEHKTAPEDSEPDVHRQSVLSLAASLKSAIDHDDNTAEAVVDDEKDSQDSDDGFADAPEATSPPQPRRRSLTRMSHSTVSSAHDGARSERSTSSPIGNRDSQASITPATTVNGSVQENGAVQAKSPISTRRISTSSLDEVSLIDELPPSKDPPPDTNETPPPVSTPSTFVGSIANRFSRSSVSSVPVNAPKPTAAPALPPRKMSTPALPAASVAPTPPPPQPPRRSPFSWLRSSTSGSVTTPPATAAQANSRRTTGSSIATVASLTTPTLGSVPGSTELLQHRMESNREGEKDDVQRGMDNLRESFRKLREAREQGTEESTEAPGGPRGSTLSFSARRRFKFLPGRISIAEEPTATEDSSSLASESTRPTSVKQEDEIDWDLWQSVVDDAYKVATERPAELNRAIQAGIPPTLRGTVWQSMAASKSLELEAMYREVICLPATATAEDARPLFGSHWLWDPSPVPSQASSPRLGSLASPGLEPKGVNGAAGRDIQWGKTVAQLDKIIKRDLGERTSFGKYKVDQKALLNVCKAYALFDPGVGYTQGMTFIATVLLLNMSEEEAFCVFVKLMNKYKLRAMFQEKMKGLELRLFQYDRILEDHEPRLAIHLKRQNIESSLYAAQWFLTLFTYKFPLQLVLRVFDLLFSEGLEAPILKFGIVLMKKNAEALLGMEFDTLGPFLKERLFDVYLDSTPSATSLLEAGFFGNGGEKEVYKANDLICDACAIKIIPEVLERYEAEWEESERLKRETEVELENLRRSNAHLQAKVKKLEEQNEELNQEYVRMASSEVALKVQNDQLADENETLRTKVDTLRDMVDKQPQEVEDRLKGEMNQLMQKNLEVHRQNQSLEENMLEMEKELVGTKMQLATVNEDYDLLKNRWNDLKKALGD